MRISSKVERQIKEFICGMQLSTCTLKTYTYALTTFYKWFEMNVKRRGSVPEQKNIIAFKNYMKDKRKLSANTIDLFHTSLKKYFDWMMKNGLINKNPVDGIRRDPKSRDFLIERLDKYQSSNLLSSFNQEDIGQLRDYTMVVIMLTMGLRRIEIERINIEDIENFRLKVQGKGQIYKDQCLKLTHLAYDSIQKYIVIRGPVNSGSPLFVSRSDRSKDKRISPCYISKMVKDHLLKIGINNPKISCHSLRHTCAYDLLEKTKDENIVQAQLRHRSIDTTHRYTHGLEIEINKEKAIQALDDIWDKRK